MTTDLSTKHALVGDLIHLPKSHEEWDKYRLSDEQVAFFHENGYLAGNRLLDDDQALTDFASAHGAALNPDTLQQLRGAIRMSRKERSEGKPPKHFRELFRLVREVVDEGSSPREE